MSLIGLRQQFGKMVKEAISSKEFDLREFAEKARVSLSVLCEILDGVYPITESDHRRIFYKIIFALGLKRREQHKLFKVLYKMRKIREARKWRWKRLSRRSFVRPRTAQRLLDLF